MNARLWPSRVRAFVVEDSGMGAAKVTAMGTVVVGVDGSEEATGALDWAADFACKFGESLMIVAASHLPMPMAHDRGGFSDGELEGWADEVLSTART